MSVRFSLSLTMYVIINTSVRLDLPEPCEISIVVTDNCQPCRSSQNQEH